MIDVRSRVERLGPLGWTLSAGFTFGIGAMMTALLVSVLLIGPVTMRGALFLGVLFSPGVGIGGFTIGGSLWGLVIEARNSYSASTGSLVGALVGLLAPFALALFFFVSGGVPDTFPAFIDEFVRRVLISGTFTSLLSGIFTVPAGAFIGWQLMRLRRSVIGKESSESGDHVQSE